ncbi:Retrovirus-related Pol polyprotein from transposon 17.6 [Araneus ventricosus]|uniref:Retrovirus-related Pol polyprotein from transposon 17.6 n=1 Tax=Araneus ventricosus TaxID=182803 RepID=A0A4Y2PIU2_ARAVE|nr:Retrovirus-related Pol polyprotein from transposon 17.6 [Araneus ventricosus]
MGLLVSKDGIKADPSHVRAINEIEKPTSKNDIKRLLGMVNFLSKFIPNVSAVTSPLRVLLKKDMEFQWNHEQETSFEEIKRLISSTPVLKVFNDSLPITIQCDSSKDGLGACLLQEGHPVSFASRSLIDCEKNYAQIEN